MKYAYQVFIAVLVTTLLVAAGGELRGRSDAHASARTRGAGYQQALAYRAALRADALREARLAAARAREASRVSAQTAYFSRLFGPNVGRWYPLVHRFFPGYERDALYVARGESGGSRYADNGVCRGLWQIHECHATRFRQVTGLPYFWGVFNAEANARYTAYMSRGGRDWSSWSVRP